jgi:hypothetical protein
MTRAIALSEEQLLAFAPDPGRGRILYERIKERLVQSLRQIADACSSVVRIDENRLAAVLDSIARTPKISSSLFAIYHEILEEANDDNVDEVSRLFDEFMKQDIRRDAIGFYNLNDEDLGSGNSVRYKRWADADPENPLRLAPLSPDRYRQMVATTNDALSLMHASSPEVSGEICSLLTEVIFASGGVGDELLFHGISSFYLWGTIFLNGDGHRTVLEVAQTLAHESSHMHLFAVAVDGPLVQNPDEDRYQSPLRMDPRPMDGIFHATYVSARMHYVLSSLLSSGALSHELVEEADHSLARHVRAFREGYLVISTHANLTKLGQDLLSRSHGYMLSYL